MGGSDLKINVVPELDHIPNVALNGRVNQQSAIDAHAELSDLLKHLHPETIVPYYFRVG